jgi:branched-chain amino acid transport system permease protein
MQVLVNGIVGGCSIALLALAFQLVYLPTKVFHVALGAVFTAVPFVAWVCQDAGIPWYLAIVVAFVFGVGFSMAIDALNHAPLERRKGGYAAHLISSLAIYIVVIQVTIILWGHEVRLLRTGIDTAVFIGSIILPHTQIETLFVAALSFGAFLVWLRLTDLGLQFRALADNAKELSMRGFSIDRLRLVAFGLSGAFVAIAAILQAREIGFYPHAGLNALMLAVIAAIIGGRSSLIGPVIGGFVLGVLRAHVAWFMSARWQDGVTFALLALFLLVRSEGILARRRRIEAEA